MRRYAASSVILGNQNDGMIADQSSTPSKNRRLTRALPGKRCRLAVVSTHPIQYYSPIFRALAESAEIDLRVFYTWSQAATNGIFDPGFGKQVDWDIPLLDGYAFQFVQNIASRPGLEHFRGLHTPSLAREIEAWGADALLVYTWNSLAHLNALRHFKGRLPVLFRGDSTLIDRRPWWLKISRWVCLRWVYSHVDVAIAVGTHNRQYFRWCGLSADRIAIAPHSVDTVRFGADAARHDARASQWRQELGIDSGAIVMVYAGKFQPKKNPHLLLDAFAALAGSAHLVFVGNGELENELRAKALRIRCDRVHFLPFQNQTLMPAVYRMGDVFVLPSQGPEETWGLAINEAMASGRPVIASTKVGGACDLIKEEETGWVFESGNREALQNILRRAIALGRDRLHDMGNLAQAASAQWSTEYSARCIAEAVLQCVAKSGIDCAE